MLLIAADNPRYWLAELNLGFVHDGRRTIISQRLHNGPLVIQKPFYPEQDVCHVYLIHPPGGIVGGDELRMNVTLSDAAHALITTPAATKFYRGNGYPAGQQQTIRVAAGCKMEWLPQETIFFSGCEALNRTQVHLQADAQFIGWEINCLGRPASQETFSSGKYRQVIELWRDEQPVVIERSEIQGGGEIMQAAWGLQGYVVVATLIASSANVEALEAARAFSCDDTELKLSVTLINDVLICRVLAQQAEDARNKLIQIWQALRPHIMQRAAHIPRIWNT